MFANIKIGIRLFAGFAAVLLLMAGLAFVGISGMSNVQGRLDEIVKDNMLKIKLNSELSESIHIVSRVMRTIILVTDEAGMRTEKAKIDNVRQRYNEAWDVLEKLPGVEVDKNGTVTVQGKKVTKMLVEGKSFFGGGSKLAVENIPADAFVIGHVGRYHPSKNHDTIFKVFLQLSKTYSNMYFIMCGKDVPGAFEAIKNKEGVANLILLENTKEPIKVYNTLNCFYFPSLTEGQPNALIEAMVLGIPFVASNISPILETVPESYHEQLVSPMDSMGTCEKIIEIYLKKPEFNIAEIARDKFNSKILFEHFYQNL
jgi:glycosyltransferase involved in cell wall biosynthesis